MLLLALSLWADEPSATVQAVNWAQLITSGGFTAMAWYLVCIYIPRMTRDFKEQIDAERDARNDERKDFLSRMREMDAGCAAERRAVMEELGKFRELLQIVIDEVKSRG